VRWDRLFDDLEAQLEAADADELAGEVADRTRRETATVALLDRLRAACGGTVELRVAGVGDLSGRLDRLGSDWLLLAVSGQPAAVVSSAALVSVRGLPAASVAEPGRVGSRLDLRYVLRGIARDRSPVRVHGIDGASYAGTIDRVGADFVDLAEHTAGDPRRAATVTSTRTVALAGIAVVRAR
jgi:hypothetical protein